MSEGFRGDTTLPCWALHLPAVRGIINEWVTSDSPLFIEDSAGWRANPDYDKLEDDRVCEPASGLIEISLYETSEGEFAPLNRLLTEFFVEHDTFAHGANYGMDHQDEGIYYRRHGAILRSEIPPGYPPDLSSILRDLKNDKVKQVISMIEAHLDASKASTPLTAHALSGTAGIFRAVVAAAREKSKCSQLEAVLPLLNENKLDNATRFSVIESVAYSGAIDEKFALLARYGIMPKKGDLARLRKKETPDYPISDLAAGYLSAHEAKAAMDRIITKNASALPKPSIRNHD